MDEVTLFQRRAFITEVEKKVLKATDDYQQAQDRLVKGLSVGAIAAVYNFSKPVVVAEVRLSTWSRLLQMLQEDQSDLQDVYDVVEGDYIRVVERLARVSTHWMEMVLDRYKAGALYDVKSEFEMLVSEVVYAPRSTE